MAKKQHRSAGLFQKKAKFPKKNSTFPEFSRSKLEKFLGKSKGEFTSLKGLFQPFQHKWEECIYGEKNIQVRRTFSFNCQRYFALRTHPELTTTNTSGETTPKTLRDSRCLSKRFAPSHVLSPCATLRVALVTSHNRFYVIGPTGFYQKVLRHPSNIKGDYATFWRERVSSGMCASSPTLLISPLTPRGEKG